MNRDPYFSGYIELHNDRGIERIEIYGDDSSYITIWINDDIADDITSKSYLSDEYGSKFYESLEDYKNGNVIGIDEVWPSEVDHGK